MGKRIMLVDDELDLLKLTGILLKKGGYEVITAKDGEEAVEVAKKTRPDFMLLDIKLPKLDGYQVFAKRREDSDLAYLPIVFATADASVNVAENTARLKANGYLLKPFETGKLLTTIEKFLPKTS